VRWWVVGEVAEEREERKGRKEVRARWWGGDR